MSLESVSASEDVIGDLTFPITWNKTSVAVEQNQRRK